MPASSVLLSVQPWVSGSSPRTYYYPQVHVQHRVHGTSWEEAIDAVMEKAAEAVRALKGNACVGIEVSLDLYQPEGPVFELVGTAALLESIYGGPLDLEAFRGLV